MREEARMAIARVIEITSSSSRSFDDAVANGVRRASDTLDLVKSAWVHDHEVKVDNGKIVEYRVKMKVTFVLKGDTDAPDRQSERQSGKKKGRK
jgi:hypothetical protein